MMEANPGIDPLLPEAGKTLQIPLQMILPDTVRVKVLSLIWQNCASITIPKEGEPLMSILSVLAN